MPGTIIDMLRRPGFREALSLRAVITLVDPVRFGQDRYQSHDAYQAQLQAADVLVANRCDLAPPEAVEAFLEGGRAMWPPKLEVTTTEHGRLDPAWLDLEPETREQHAHDHHHAEHLAHRGWVWPPAQVWTRERLVAVIQDLVRPSAFFPDGVLRLKGVFRTPGAWWMVQAASDRVSVHPVQHRRDSRLEILATQVGPGAWDHASAVLETAHWRRDDL
jgi:G3E family GTPase